MGHPVDNRTAFFAVLRNEASSGQCMKVRARAKPYLVAFFFYKSLFGLPTVAQKPTVTCIMDTLVNRVAASGLITVKLEEYWPTTTLATFDLKDYLFMELILKEKDFRAVLKAHDFSQYQDKVLLVFCSADAIIPAWAYMLVAQAAAPFAADIYQGTEADYLREHFRKAVAALDLAAFTDQRVVIKGCGEKDVPASAYLDVTARLQPVVKSLMFGEPCSTVPVYKKGIARK